MQVTETMLTTENGLDFKYIFNGLMSDTNTYINFDRHFCSELDEYLFVYGSLKKLET